MSWQGIEGHDDIVELFRRSLRQGRLASTFLFVGPNGIGKRTLALKLAQSLLCQENPAEQLDPCGRCASCAQVLAQTHPDLELIAKPADKSFIPLASFIGADSQRMRAGLCHWIALRPFMGGRRVAIIDDADYLNEEGANCLLKTLEEPPPRSVLILIGTSPEKQLPTIRSRSQLIRFRPLSEPVVTQLLVTAGEISDVDEARRLAAHSGGSLAGALELADGGLWEFRGQLLSELARPVLRSVEFSRRMQAFVEEAGKEASARRIRLRQAIGFAVEFYRQLLRTLSGLEPGGDAHMKTHVQQAAAGSIASLDRTAELLDRSLEALEQVDRNANQATLIECWLDDLARIGAGQYLGLVG